MRDGDIIRLDVRAGALTVQRIAPAVIAGNVVVVGLEPPRQPELAVEDERRHERRGVVTPPLQDFRQRGQAVVQAPPSVRPHAVLRRIQSGEQAGVGRQSQGRDGIRAFAQHPRGRQRVENRRSRRRITVTTQPVGAGRVESDQEHVQPNAGGPDGSGSSPEEAPGEGRQSEGGEAEDQHPPWGARRAAHGRA